MKKVFFAVLFCFAIVASATEKKEVVDNPKDEKEVVVTNSTLEKVEINDFEKKTSEDEMFFGCASEGNEIYAIEIAEGATHREARATRRAYVRKCRNYFWQFGIF